MSAKKHESKFHVKASKGQIIVFCPGTQSRWPKGESPEGEVVDGESTLLADAVYEPKIGMRSRDIQAAGSETLLPPSKDF